MLSQTVVVIGNGLFFAQFRRWIVRDLAAAGHRVIACAPDRPGLAAEVTHLGAEFLPISLDRTGMNPLRDLRDLWGLARSLRALRADVVISHQTKLIVLGTLAARLAGIRRVFAMVEGFGYAFTDGREPKRLLMRGLLQSLFSCAFRLCTGVFVLNEDDRRLAMRTKMVSSRQQLIRVHGTGIDLDEFAEVPPADATPRFLLIGRLLREKGIAEYVEAARLVKQRHPHCRFQLIGPVDSNPGAIDAATFATWRGEGVIEYVGEVEDVRPYLRDCTVYVLPSYREGMPRTVLEALAIGRAVITTTAPGCRETVHDGVNGFLVPPRNAAALADAMLRFIDQPALIAVMGRASRALAERVFDVRAVNSLIMRSMNLAAPPVPARTPQVIAARRAAA
jgi:glycosyltransferase involved in cell wall biosynthesis